MDVSRETLVSRHFSQRANEVLRFSEWLSGAGIERGLIGPREKERIWERHIANCLPVATLIRPNKSVVDLGSGAGLPGILIALARPDLEVTLVEPLARRAEFLREVIADLHLPMTVIQGKANSVKKEFDYVTARALAPLRELVPMAWPLLRAHGSLLAIKGERAEEELRETTLPPGAQVEIHELQLQDLPPGRVIEVLKAG